MEEKTLQIRFNEGVEGPLRVVNTARYERSFEGEGPFTVTESEWAHLSTLSVNVMKEERLGSLSGSVADRPDDIRGQIREVVPGEKRPIRVSKNILAFVVVEESALPNFDTEREE